MGTVSSKISISIKNFGNLSKSMSPIVVKIRPVFIMMSPFFLMMGSFFILMSPFFVMMSPIFVMMSPIFITIGPIFKAVKMLQISKILKKTIDWQGIMTSGLERKILNSYTK